jgi:hypothetical protein
LDETQPRVDLQQQERKVKHVRSNEDPCLRENVSLKNQIIRIYTGFIPRWSSSRTSMHDVQ